MDDQEAGEGRGVVGAEGQSALPCLDQRGGRADTGRQGRAGLRDGSDEVQGASARGRGVGRGEDDARADRSRRSRAEVAVAEAAVRTVEDVEDRVIAEREGLGRIDHHAEDRAEGVDGRRGRGSHAVIVVHDRRAVIEISGGRSSGRGEDVAAADGLEAGRIGARVQEAVASARAAVGKLVGDEVIAGGQGNRDGGNIGERVAEGPVAEDARSVDE